jgi:4-hydroxybenzoate polyprenyltransferase
MSILILLLILLLILFLLLVLLLIFLCFASQHQLVLHDTPQRPQSIFDPNLLPLGP